MGLLGCRTLTVAGQHGWPLIGLRHCDTRLRCLLGKLRQGGLRRSQPCARQQRCGGQRDQRQHRALRDEPRAQPFDQSAVEEGGRSHRAGAQREQHGEAIARIELIDGARLPRLLVQYGVGVQELHTVVLHRIDEDFFEEI